MFIYILSAYRSCIVALKLKSVNPGRANYKIIIIRLYSAGSRGGGGPKKLPNLIFT